MVGTRLLDRLTASDLVLLLWDNALLEDFPLLPPMGNLTLVIAALSYAPQLGLTAAADRDSCPDVEMFARGVRAALDDLARSGLATATEQAWEDKEGWRWG